MVQVMQISQISWLSSCKAMPVLHYSAQRIILLSFCYYSWSTTGPSCFTVFDSILHGFYIFYVIVAKHFTSAGVWGHTSKLAQCRA